MRGRLDVSLFTPGEPKGRPLTLPIVPPGFDQLPEADRERFAQYAAAALGSMIGFRTSEADKSQRAILAKAIETLATLLGAPITLPTLRGLIGEQDEALLNAIGGGYPAKYYDNLAQRLLTLELNNRQLLTGNERLDVDALLGTGPHAQPGRVRLSVISTRFLGDAAKVDFWVSQLLVAVSRWCAKSPKAQLQAVFLFDEADIYLPAGMKQPATKAPMEDLLKRARSAGVGVFLATQSPGDLDYKCKENVRTWLIGRVKEKTAIEKLKPMLAAAKGNVIDKLAGQKTGRILPRPRVERDTGAVRRIIHVHRATAGERDRGPGPPPGLKSLTSRTSLGETMMKMMPRREGQPGSCRPGDGSGRSERRRALVGLLVIGILAAMMGRAGADPVTASTGVAQPTAAADLGDLPRTVAEVGEAVKSFEKRDIDACLRQLGKAVKDHPELAPPHALLAKLAFLANQAGDDPARAGAGGRRGRPASGSVHTLR